MGFIGIGYGSLDAPFTQKAPDRGLKICKHPEIKKQLWGGEFWSDGYFVSTIGKHANEQIMQNYVKEQGKDKEYKHLYKNEQQLKLF